MLCIIQECIGMNVLYWGETEAVEEAVTAFCSVLLAHQAGAG